MFPFLKASFLTARRAVLGVTLLLLFLLYFTLRSLEFSSANSSGFRPDKVYSNLVLLYSNLVTLMLEYKHTA